MASDGLVSGNGWYVDDVTITGRRLQGIEGFLFLRSGIEVIEVKAIRATTATARIRIAKD